MKKTAVYTITSLFVILLICSCQNSNSRKYQTIEQVVDELYISNILFEGIGYVSSVKIYDSNNEKIVDFQFRVSEVPQYLQPYCDLSAYNKNTKAAKELFLTEVRGLEGEIKELFESLAYFNYSARFNLFAGNDTTTATVILSPEEIKQTLSKPPYTDINEFKLDVLCRGTNIYLPQNVDPIIKWVAVTLDLNYLVYRYEINDSQLSVGKMLDSYKINNKQQLIYFYSENFESTKETLWNVVASKRGIKHVFIGTSSGEVVVQAISAKELEDLYYKLKH